VIGQEEIVAAMPAGHPLATRAPGVTFAELAAEPVVHYHPDNGLGGWLDAVAARHGVILTATMRTRQAATAAQLAAAGIGVALVPTTALAATYAGALRRLDPPLQRQVVSLIADPADTLVQRFSADIRRHGVPIPAPITAKLDEPQTGPRPRPGPARDTPRR
jgi:DNA-binding transcriptional LysR family regulator